MSRVIKNNDGVAIVEGTPAASLVKDLDRFFASKPPERMAGESISQPRKLDPRAINTRRPTPKDLEQMNNPPVRSGGRPAESEVVLDTFMGRGAAEPEEQGRRPTIGTGKEPEEQGRRPTIGTGKEPEVVLDTFMGRRPTVDRKKEPEVILDTLKGESKSSEPAIKTNVEKETPQEKEMKREEALDKTREFKRQRAAERSADEQERTKGKFISTLRR